MIGRDLTHFRITAKLGKGGMGEVYLAEDSRLGRKVAIKVLPAAFVGNAERLARFEREAKVLASLNHPNIASIHQVEESEGVHFLVMELAKGETLAARLADGPLAVDEAMAIALQIAEALAAAHAKGVIHRDLKPTNVMVSAEGQVKVLDFGLAKEARHDPDPTDLSMSPTLTAGPTEAGAVMGTAAYMSPEQAEGRGVDPASDVFSFGLVLYEMLTGGRPFDRESFASTVAAVLHDQPPPIREVRKDVPPALRRIVARCLEKRSEARFADGSELHGELVRLRERYERSRTGPAAWLRRPAVALPALALLVLVAAGLGWVWMRGAGERWARREALPELARLVSEKENVEAFVLGREAAQHLPDDPQLEKLLETATVPITIVSDPPGANLSIKDYLDLDGEWIPVGTTPLTETRLPAEYLRVRLELSGYEIAERAINPWFGYAELPLTPEGEGLPGMIQVGAGAVIDAPPETAVGPFWIDRYEVTNRQYQEFVDAGGYSDRQYWKQPFVDDGRTLSWEEVMVELRDTTGRPGPATWELGRYPEGEDDYPVRGVSWYEATAYAEFRGNSLPTVHHWRHAAAYDVFGEILALANLEGSAPRPVGASDALSGSGAQDMAGNAREWSWNALEEKRYILGGAWHEPKYFFVESYTASPLDRSPENGFRTVRYLEPPEPHLLAPVERLAYDFSQVEPASGEVYEVYRRLYDYDPGPLEAAVESVDDSNSQWIKETVSFAAAYGGERVIAHLFLPRDVQPPYQAVVYFPGGTAQLMRSSETLAEAHYVDFIPRSGRVLVYPIYKGTYERLLESRVAPGSVAGRDLAIQRVKDFRRTVDYLLSRDDIDADHLGFLGISWGGNLGPRLLALENRIRTGILASAGYLGDMLPWQPEMQTWHFAPRVRQPVLMINGRSDFIMPYETSQKPMFEHLGTPDEHKRHALLEGGHLPDLNLVIGEALDWYDRYLGPVERTR